MLSFLQWLRENRQISGYYGDDPIIDGEYWLQDGQAIGADGDVGDVNHEGYVISMVQSSVADELGQSDHNHHEYIDWDAVIAAVAKEYRDEYGMSADDYSDGEIAEKVAVDQNIDPEEWKIANGGGDARLYAMKKYGWQIIRGHNIETWNINPGIMKSIANGIGEIVQDIDDDQAEQAEFSIYVHSNGRRLTATLAQLERGTLAMQLPIHHQIDVINQSMRNIGRDVVMDKKPIPPGQGSTKTVADMPYSQYRREKLNNFGELFGFTPIEEPDSSAFQDNGVNTRNNGPGRKQKRSVKAERLFGKNAK